MKIRSLVLCLLVLSLAASAGTLSGNVKADPGPSVVYLESTTVKSFPASTTVYKMNQKAMRFTPDLLVIPKGATVEFLNDDAGPHNVFWRAISGKKALGHNVGTFVHGHSASWKFEYPGVVPVQCNMHPEMSATIIVTPTPYYAETDALLGDYFIQNIPDGQYNVTVWHNGKTTSKQVTIAGDTKADFTLPAK